MGQGGVFKLGYWTEAELTVTAGEHPLRDAVLTAELADGDGLRVVQPAASVSLAKNESRLYRFLVRPGRPDAPIEVRLHSPHGTVSRVYPAESFGKPLPATQELSLQVQADLQVAGRRSMEGGAAAGQSAVVVERFLDLPTDPLGYDGVDRLWISTSGWTAEPSETEKEAIQQRVAAILHWVQSGGRAVVILGRSAPLLVGEGEGVFSPLVGVRPPARQGNVGGIASGNGGNAVPAGARFRQMVRRPPTAWENAAETVSEPLRDAGSSSPAMIEIALFENLPGSIEAGDAATPLIVRRTEGLGEIVLVTADIDRPPFQDWAPRAKLLEKITARDLEADAAVKSVEASAQVAKLGYADLSGQLRAALDQHPGVLWIPFWTIWLLGATYLALLFPLSWLLSAKLGTIWAPAWLLIPLVLVGSGTAFYALGETAKGSACRANIVEQIDTDLISGQIRGHCWSSVFSPPAQRMQVRFVPPAKAAKESAASRAGADGLAEGLASGRIRASWLGLPGSGLGGMNSALANPDLFDAPYSYSNDFASLVDVPLAARSSKGFVAAWERSLAPDTEPARLVVRDRRPSGAVVNGTGVDLSDCILLYGGWAYPLGSLGRSQSVALEGARSPITVVSYLTERKLIGDKERATPYDPAGDDLRRILQMILFHEAAGGRRYTGLTSRYLHRLDWSNLLGRGEAVLLATGPTTIPAVQVRGQQGEVEIGQTLAVYRWRLPVLAVDSENASDFPPLTLPPLSGTD